MAARARMAVLRGHYDLSGDEIASYITGKSARKFHPGRIESTVSRFLSGN